MKKTAVIIILTVIISAIIMPLVALAATEKGLISADGHRPLAQVTLPQELKPTYAVNIAATNPNDRAAVGNVILQTIAGSLIYAAGPIAVLMIAVGGFRYIVAHGEQAEMEKAKKTITWAIIGLIVIIVSFAIVSNIIRISQSTNQPPAGQSTGQGGQQGGANGTPAQSTNAQPGENS